MAVCLLRTIKLLKTAGVEIVIRATKLLLMADVSNDKLSRYTKGSFASASGTLLCTHLWAPPAAALPKQPLVLILHGLGAHGSFPTVTLLAERLSSRGFRVASLDFPGCGQSGGVRGLLPPADALVADALAFAASVCGGSPLLVAGTSLGGGLALRASQLPAPNGVCIVGLILLSPLVSVPAKSVPPAPVVALLSALAWLAPTAALLSNPSADPGAQYKDPVLREACVADPYQYHGNLRLGTAASLLALSRTLESSLESVDVPFIVVHGTADTVVNIQSSRELMRRSASVSKVMHEVDGGLHALLCELPPVREKILETVVTWAEGISSASDPKPQAKS